MSETETKKEEKNATTAKAQTVNVEAEPPETGTNPPPKPHRKSNYVTLMPGQSETQSFFATLGESTVAIFPKHGKVFKLVDHDTTEPNTINREMGEDLVKKQLFVYADAPDKDAPPFVEAHDPASPQGDMAANGIVSGEGVGGVVSIRKVAIVGDDGPEIIVPAPFVTTPDGGIIPVAPQPGFTSADAPIVETA